MIDRGGRARLTILAPPWAVPRNYTSGDRAMILTDAMMGSFASTMDVFSFGVVAIEVRLVHLVAYSVGGGEMDGLSSA